MPMVNAALKTDLEAFHADAQSKFGLSAHYVAENSLHYVTTERVGTEETYVIKGVPSALVRRNDPKAPAKTRVYIGVNDGIIRKPVFYDQEGKETYSQVCGNVRKDPSISTQDFEFVPPEGTKVIEVNDTDVIEVPSPSTP